MALTSNPRVYSQLLSADTATFFADRMDLMVGQMTAAATATDGVLYEDTQFFTVTEITTLFGINSELTNRIFQHRAGNDGVSRLDVIPKADAGAAVQAFAPLVLMGTQATEDKSFQVAVVDKFQYTATIDALTDDTPTQIGDKIEAALNALIGVPIMAANNLGTVTATATNGGTVGNFYYIEIIGDLPAGITATLTGFSGGATDPTLTDIFDVIGEQRYHFIAWPEAWFDELNIIESFLEARFNVSESIQRGFGFYGHSDTFANNLSLANTSNSRVLYPCGNNIKTTAIFDGPAARQPADYKIAYLVGVLSKLLTTGASIGSDVITTDGPLDSIGGAHMASKPLFNLAFPNAPLAAFNDLYTVTEQRELETAGFSVFGRVANSVVTGPIVCPYKTDSGGNENITFHYLNYSLTGDVCSEIFETTTKAKFASSRLSSGDPVARYTMATKGSIQAHIMSTYRDLSNMALTVAGDDAELLFSSKLKIILNTLNGMVTITGVLPIVTQLRTIFYSYQFSFKTNT